MSSPVNTTKSLGWLTRIFGGSSTNQTETPNNSETSASGATESPSITRKRVADARNLIKDLSPSNGSTNTEKPTGKGLRSLNSPVASLLRKANTDAAKKDNSNTTDGTKRKRLLSEETSAPLEDIFAHNQSSVKRFCGNGANYSLIEEPIKISVPERLDATWSGDMSFGINPSPASSVRSLKSRLSGAASNASSGLSSRTRAILQQLEKVHTPASEARRLPTMRAQGIVSERWSHATSVLSSPGAPPLRKMKSAVPTRLQLLSTTLGYNKKPYWKDIYRKPTERTVEQNGGNTASADKTDLNGSMLAPILDIPETPKTKPAEEPDRRVSKLKGADGVSRNVFNTKELDELEEEVNILPIPKPITLKMTAPSKGFLNDLNFSFDLPKERGAQITPPKRQVDSGSSSSEEDSGDESDASSASEAVEQEDSPVPETKKQETPAPAPAVSFASAAPSVSSASSVTTAPAAAGKWDCSVCFIGNMGEKCAACGAPRNFAPAAAAAAPPPPPPAAAASAKWDCSVCFISNNTGDKCAACGAARTTAPAAAAAAATWDCSVCFIGNNTGDKCAACGAARTTAPAAAAAATWDCSVCFIGNNTGDKCAACGTGRAGPVAAAAPKKYLVSNISTFATKASTTVSFGFGAPKTDAPAPAPAVAPANAFKPTTTNSTVSFGLSGGSTAKPTTSYSFGFGSKPAEPGKEDAAKATASAAPAIPSITVSDTSKNTTTPLFGTGSGTTPLFGTAAPKFNGLGSSTASAPASTAAATLSAPSTSTTTTPLFGSLAKPVESAPAPSTSTAPTPLFGSLAKPADTTTAAPAGAPLFGSTPSTSTSSGLFSTSTPLFGAGLKPAEPAQPTSNLFGAKPVTETAAPSTSVPLFGAKPAENGTSTAAPAAAPAPSSNVFVFGASSSTPAAPAAGGLFGTPAVVEAPKPAPLFGAPAQDKPLFGAATAAPAAPAATSFFSGATSTAAPLFGGLSQPQPAQAPAPLFGAPKADDAPATKKPMFSFGDTSAAPAPTFGPSSSTGNLFGNSGPSGFGASSGSSLFGATPAQAPSLSASSSTNSLFGASTEPPKSFNFGGVAPPAQNQPFVFGSVTPAAPSMTFGQPTAPAAAPGGAFAYSASSGGMSAGARKIATARRRIPGRK